MALKNILFEDVPVASFFFANGGAKYFKMDSEDCDIPEDMNSTVISLPDDGRSIGLSKPGYLVGFTSDAWVQVEEEVWVELPWEDVPEGALFRWSPSKSGLFVKTAEEPEASFKGTKSSVGFVALDSGMLQAVPTSKVEVLT
jgi:hypothetical protein